MDGRDNFRMVFYDSQLIKADLLWLIALEFRLTRHEYSAF